MQKGVLAAKSNLQLQVMGLIGRPRHLVLLMRVGNEDWALGTGIGDCMGTTANRDLFLHFLLPTDCATYGIRPSRAELYLGQVNSKLPAEAPKSSSNSP